MNYSFSIDTEVMINNPVSQINSWSISGRWSLGFTKYLLHLIPINISLTNCISVILLIINAVLWTYYFQSISSIKNDKCNIVFMLAIVSSPILCEQIGFTLQALEIMLGFIVMAIAMTLLNKWIYSTKIQYLVISIILVTYSFGHLFFFMLL